MAKSSQQGNWQPRILHYRTHYRLYCYFLFSLALLVCAVWSWGFYKSSFAELVTEYSFEFALSAIYFLFLPFGYFFWLRPRINHTVQVYPTHLLIHKGKSKDQLMFENMESVVVVGWSLFYLKMKDGHKYYFNSDLERVDYIWEGIQGARPELIQGKEYEDFRVNLVKSDHHQKRKEWFLKHRLVDIVNWVVAPLFFLSVAYFIQSQSIVIYQQGPYFFRLLMFSLLILLLTSWVYSMLLKKLVFDRILDEKSEDKNLDKVRDLEFEGVIIQRSKMFQIITACFLFAFVIKWDFNLFSVSKTRSDWSYFKIPAGKTIIVDNRYNCFKCRYGLSDGDLVMFGKGMIGQVMAREGEPVAEVLQDTRGRTIASLNVQQVPSGHLAVKAGNGKDIMFIKVADLVGKIQN